ncbi:MFS transporter [Acidobacteria bacterium AH-259-D05]|nr:MFS transporter [Acidobacteria bacterium AH-259-D05]
MPVAVALGAAKVPASQLLRANWAGCDPGQFAPHVIIGRMAEPERMVPDSVSSAAEAAGEISSARGLPFFSRTFSAFRYRDYRLMWFGAFTSTTGTWMQQVAEAWVVLSLTGSAFYLGLTSFLGQLPIILFTLVGGVIADRLDRRKLLLGSQYVQMATALILTLLIFYEWIQIWHFLVLVFVVGTAQAFGGPAYQALIPSLVKKEDLPNAIALNSIQFNLARVFGPVLAGTVLALVGPALCFGLNGLSFGAVIISLYLIRARFKPPKTDESVLQGMRKGLSFVTSQGAIWQLSTLGFIVTFCGIPVMTLLPVFARDIFHTGATGYSTMMTTSGIGSVTGALLYASLGKIKGRGMLALRVQLVMALVIATFALSRNLVLSYVALFLGGVCLMTLIASISSLVQLAITEEMRGRVMSVFMLAFRGGMPLGSLAAGALASQFSPTLALLIMSSLLAVSGLAFLAARSPIREL